MQLLYAATYDNLDNAWATATTILSGSGAVAGVVGGGFWSGPRGCTIEEIVFNARDTTYTDPAGDVYIGHQVLYSSDQGSTWTTALQVIANADCPQLWNDTTNLNVSFVVSQPVRAWNFVGAGTGTLSEGRQWPALVLPANVWVKIEVAPVIAAGIKDMPAADLDSFDVYAYGSFNE
jgi:hypothetical protein